MDITTLTKGLSVVLTIILVVVLFGSVLYVTSPRGRARRKSHEPFFIMYWDVEVIIFVVLLVTLLAWGVSQGVQSQEDNAMDITAANTPVHLFLALSPDLTVEEVEVMAEEYGWKTFSWEALGSNTTEMDIYPEESDYLGSTSVYGVTMQLTFFGEDSKVLQSATLLIKTEYGTATCYYYPTDETEYGRETGFNLTVKAKGKLFSEKYLLEAAQEVIDIAYPIVYPDGLA
ncbi:MAG: hypothetical protein LUE21_01700 [Oscillospiraceae bacterium]|nr:hypothetical protein [Oscillospiraceae bacterium]